MNNIPFSLTFSSQQSPNASIQQILYSVVILHQKILSIIYNKLTLQRDSYLLRIVCVCIK